MKKIAFQFARFLAVGGGATAIHVAVALLSHTLFGVSPLWSNFIAFLTALTFSYAGHWLWTFSSATAGHRFAAPRFFALATSSFGVNHAIVYAITQHAGLPLWAALIPVVVVVPLLNFWFNRIWVFLPRRAAA